MFSTSNLNARASRAAVGMSLLLISGVIITVLTTSYGPVHLAPAHHFA